MENNKLENKKDFCVLGLHFDGITPTSAVNGEGLRTVIWFCGCSHNCMDCHNAPLQDATAGIQLTAFDYNRLLVQLDKPYIDGITLSGGDPLYIPNRKAMLAFIKALRRDMPVSKTIWMYTGFTWETLMQQPDAVEILKYVDVLVDGRYDARQRELDLQKHDTVKFRGDTKQRVIDVPASVYNNDIVYVQGFAPYTCKDAKKTEGLNNGV